jgi:DNA polymerase III epsilon subunit-like protein
MRVLVFDTETTGLPPFKNINLLMLHLWPHIVQFSYIIYDTNLNKIVEVSDSIIQVNDDVEISEYSTMLHGITKKISIEKGVNINNTLNTFFEHLQTVDMLVGHNIVFDIKMITVEVHRIIKSNDVNDDIKSFENNLQLLKNYKNICCTLQDSIEFCNIKMLTKNGKSYLKFPKLVELHYKLFNSNPNNLHNSLNDVLITLRCYMMLKFKTDLNESCDDFHIIAQDIQLI